MERNLTIIGICAFLAFIGYTYVDQAKNTNTSADNKYNTKIKIENYDLMFDKGDENYFCFDPKACNYNKNVKPEYIDNDKCEYKTSDCDTCSGENDGTGKVIDHDYNDDGICDHWNTLSQKELDKILNNLIEKDSLEQLEKRTLNVYMPHGSDLNGISKTIKLDAYDSFDPNDGDIIEYLWTSNDIYIENSENKEIEFDVYSIKDSINSYKIFLEITDDYEGKSMDSVIINVYQEENKDPISEIYHDQDPYTIKNPLLLEYQFIEKKLTLPKIRHIKGN